MKLNKTTNIVLLILCIIFLTACESTQKSVNQSSSSTDSNVLHCTRKAQATDAQTDLNYSIYYNGDYVVKTVSIEKITSDDKDVLNKYKEAYEKVFEPYKNIDYYDNTVSLTGNNVISTTIIDYEKVDTSKILSIEGDEGNIFENDGKIKKDTLVTMYKKYGATCK